MKQGEFFKALENEASVHLRNSPSLEMEGAASWVEATAKMDADNAGPVPDRAEADGLQPGIGFLMRDIYIPAENNVRSIWGRPGTLLYNLSRRVDNLASATGFRKHALTLYLLTGLEPILPRVNICVNLGRADLLYPRVESGSEPRGKLLDLLCRLHPGGGNKLIIKNIVKAIDKLTEAINNILPGSERLENEPGLV